MNPYALFYRTKPLIFKQQFKPATVMPNQELLRVLLLGLVLCAPLSLAAETAPEGQPNNAQTDTGSDPRILPDLEQERLQALANSQLPDTQTLWLETSSESFLGLFKPANMPVAQGAVLLLHHDRTSADWPGSITTLRQGLPDQGWHTLSIALPDAPEYIPPRTEDVLLAKLDNTGSAAAPSSTTPPEANPDKLQAHFEQISARIESGLNYLGQQQPAKLLILGEGSGGYWALRYSTGPGQARALFPVLIDTVPPTTPTLPDLVELIATMQRPTLDLYHSNGRDQQPIEVLARQRQDAAKRQGSGLLISSRMPSRAGDWRQPDKRLLGVMRGMLPKLISSQSNSPTVSAQQQKQTTPGMR